MSTNEPLWRSPKPIEGKALHALIVGVSAYKYLPAPDCDPTPHQAQYGLGMSQLTCAARTAFAIHEWLVQARMSLEVPLATSRVLLSATTAELKSTPSLRKIAKRVPRADIESFLIAAKAWRADAATHRDNMTLFYFAGHGIQRLRDGHVMLFEDFGDGLGSKLKNGVDTQSLINGMAVTQSMRSIARQQLYFVDACRRPPDEERTYESQEPTRAFDSPAIDTGDDRVCPVFFTAEAGTQAFAVRNDQTLFSKALLACLNGHGTVRVSDDYFLTDYGLIQGLNYSLPRIAAQYKARQSFRVSGQGPCITLRRHPGRPNVDVRVQVDPEHQAIKTQVSLFEESADKPIVIGPPIKPHPYETMVPAGGYTVTISIDGATRARILTLAPPSVSIPIDARPVLRRSSAIPKSPLPVTRSRKGSPARGSRRRPAR